MKARLDGAEGSVWVETHEGSDAAPVHDAACDAAAAAPAATYCTR